MAISQRLKAFLESSKLKYTAAKHPVVYTAQEIAAAQHVPGRQLAKCVLVKTSTGPALAVLPAARLIDFKKLKSVLGTKSVSIGKEADIKQLFPDMEVGAMSPFGHLYGVPVIVDRELSEAGDIVFNAGSHTDTIKMRYQDFAGAAKPKLGAFGLQMGGPKKKKAGGPAGKRSKPKTATRRPTKKPARKKKAKR